MHSPNPSDSNGFGRCSGAGFERNAEMPGGCHGRHGRRGPRMFDAGMLRYVVLKHIAEQPRHGYDLIKLLQEQSGGLYTPSPGMIYPMLAMLEDLGHVSADADGNKKLYTITEQGREFLQQNQALVAAIEEQIAARRSAGGEQMRERLRALRDTIYARVRGQQLSPEQVRQIASVLDRALAEIQAL
ncbi:PadR family transcriptional regulator [Thiomonas sp. FB-Cd]|uniref:PadR family transcriptional regulator n=1 Tax=Thiomonas sp. FB-Cd TaxID=1158292 RepID=UPI00068CF67B|nr:PadR family transcriptional regulator [Thiomonas sp. FB-Cd]